MGRSAASGCCMVAAPIRAAVLLKTLQAAGDDARHGDWVSCRRWRPVGARWTPGRGPVGGWCMVGAAVQARDSIENPPGCRWWRPVGARDGARLGPVMAPGGRATGGAAGGAARGGDGEGPVASNCCMVDNGAGVGERLQAKLTVSAPWRGCWHTTGARGWRRDGAASHLDSAAGLEG